MAHIAAGKLLMSLKNAGLSVELRSDKGLAVTPASKLTPHLRHLIREGKSAIIEWLDRVAANDQTAEWLTQPWVANAFMDDAEIAIFQQRLAVFAGRGQTEKEAELAAECLLRRDREWDDRRSCIECTHLRPTPTPRCGNWAAGGVATREGDSLLGSEFISKLQRCAGFQCAATAYGLNNTPELGHDFDPPE